MPIRIVEVEKEGPRKVKTDFRKKRQQEYMKKHGKPDKKRIQIRPEVSDKMQKLRDNLASVSGGEWGKKSGGRIGLKEGGWPKGGPSKPRPSFKNPIQTRRLKDFAKKGSPDISERLGGRIGKEAPRQKKKSRNVFGASDEKIHKKPHATREGSWASIKRAAKRFKDKTYKIEDYGDKSLDTQWKAENKARKQKMAKGGRIGLQHGNRPRPQGPHTWVKSGGAVLKGKKVGIQIK